MRISQHIREEIPKTQKPNFPEAKLLVFVVFGIGILNFVGLGIFFLLTHLGVTIVARGKQGKVTQKEMVLTAIQEKGWEAGPQELLAVIKEKFNTELPNNVISNYKSVLKREGGKSGAPAGKRGRKSGPAFEDFEAVRGLVNRLGAEQVKQLVDMAGIFS